jgi:hypothetical protein
MLGLSMLGLSLPSLPMLGRLMPRFPAQFGRDSMPPGRRSAQPWGRDELAIPLSIHVPDHVQLPVSVNLFAAFPAFWHLYFLQCFSETYRPLRPIIGQKSAPICANL